MAWRKGGCVGVEPKSGQENYEDLLKIWIDRGMSTFHYFLEYYNNLDVEPFVTTVTRFQEFYKENHLDVFKVAISAPGLARQLLFRCTETEGAVFPLFHKQDEDLYRTVKTGICGGSPSFSSATTKWEKHNCAAILTRSVAASLAMTQTRCTCGRSASLC